MKAFPCFASILGASLAFGALAAQTFHYQATVVDTNGQPVSGAIVESYRVADTTASAETSPQLQERGTTDASGTVTFTTTNQTIFTLIARKPGFSLSWSTSYPNAASETNTAELLLTRPLAVAGMVQDAAGKPVPDAAVWVCLAARSATRGEGFPPREMLYSKLGRQRLDSRTDAAGRFRIDGLPSDATVELMVTKPTLALDQPPRPWGGSGLSLQAGESNIVLVVKPASVIEGRVTQADTGTPVAGARIVAAAGAFGDGVQPPSVTAPDGNFRLADLSAGEYRLRATVGTNEFPDWVCDVVTATVDAGATNRDVKITASHGGVLEVIVRDPSSNQPIKDAYVSASKQATSQGVRTSDQGMARMRLVPGDYQLFVSREGLSRYQSQVTVAGGQTNQLTVTLEPAARISGTVLDPNDSPVPKATVSLFPNQRVETRTDTEGRFTLTYDPNQFTGMQVTQHSLIARDPAGLLAVALDVEEESSNVTVRLEPALTLAGRVTDTNGNAIANAEVQTMYWTERMSSSLGPPVRTDAQGRFEVKGLPSGHRYQVFASATGFGRSGRIVDSPETDKLRAELEPLQLPPANLRIAGVVVDADDKPVAGAFVNGFGEAQPSLNGRTDVKGRFSFDHVCAGPIQLSANNPSGGGYGNTAAEGGDTNITIQIGATQTFGRSGKTLKIAGSVVDTDGKPAPKIMVSLFPMPQGERRTDAEGRYTLTFDSNQFGGMQINQRIVVARDATRNLAASANVEEDTTNVNLRLEPGLTLAGRVTDTDGKAITNAEAQVVLMTDRMGSGIGSSVRVDAEGRFEIKGLPSDRRYSVTASAKGFGQESRNVETPEAETRRVELDPFELPVANQRIAGVVLDDNDKPVPHARIFSYGNKQRNVNAETDAKGQFSFDKVCAGPIHLSANNMSGGFGNVTAEAGDTNIVIRMRTAMGMGRQPPRRATLNGNPLPDLATVNLASDAAPVGRPVLLCLFDFEQRPSRRVVRLLAEQHDALRQKGVSVLAVQAPVTSAESLQSWKNANPVPFPVGSVLEKSDKTKWASEVDSLPWLILTDADHRVAAEGFMLDELDAKLAALKK